MKLPAVLFVGSIVLNAALAAVFLQRPSVQRYFFRGTPSAAARPRAPAIVPAAAGAADPAGSSTWSELSTGNLPDAIARLRAGGIPLRYLRVIAEALIAERNADRHRAIADAVAAKPWWQSQNFQTDSDYKIASMRRQLGRDERAQLFELLGPQSDETAYGRAWAERKYGGLAPGRMEQVSRTNRDYTDLMADVRAQARDIILSEDREKLAYIEQQRHTDLAKILTPEELFNFTLRSSPIANRLRDQLAAFEPSEEEFRVIFKVHQTVEDQFGDGRVQNLTQEERRQRNDAIRSLGDQIQAVLSPERFADYQLKTDPAYIQTQALVANLGLPNTTTAQVVAVQKDAAAQMAAVTADRTLTAVQRSSQLAAIAQEATARLTGSLGENGLATYRHRAGSWLTNLEARAQPPRPIPTPKE